VPVASAHSSRDTDFLVVIRDYRRTTEIRFFKIVRAPLLPTFLNALRPRANLRRKGSMTHLHIATFS
jgi:hypothetical protein